MFQYVLNLSLLSCTLKMYAYTTDATSIRPYPKGFRLTSSTSDKIYLQSLID